jgi:cytochrome c oxidase subunit 2
VRYTLWIALLCGYAASALGADTRAGQALYAVCAGCHGFAGQGNATIGAPKLAGLDAWNLVRQLDNFRHGVRGTVAQDRNGKQMATMALAVPDSRATEDVVAYIGQLSPTASSATVHGDAEQGRNRYALCAACHGAQGEGLEQLGAPKLAGLDDWYVVAQLRAFKEGLRGTHSDDTYGQQMRAIAASLENEQALLDIAAVIDTFE